MHKVLIVDDESWVVESLKDLVDWNSYGFEVVGQAYNGVDALEAMRVHQPDVVFTDIRMPEMNGLELLQRGKSLPFPIHFVVVSGYAEFAYAQKAISYGAIAYCLKPFDEMEISGILLKLNKTLNAAKPSLDSSLIHLLEDPNAENQLKLQDELKKYDIKDWNTAGIVVVVSVGSESLPDIYERVIKLKIGTSKTAYLLNSRQSEALRRKWTDELPIGVMGIGVSEKITDLKEIKIAIANADLLAHQFFVTRETGAYYPQAFKYNELNQQMMEMSHAVRDRDNKAVNRIFEHIEVLFKEKALTIQHAFQVYNMTVSFLFKLGQTENILYSYEQLLQSYKHVFDMLDELRSLAKRYLQASDSHSLETKNQAFNSILQFVTLNFREDISLQNLSDQFFMNPSYISQLFKKEVGETFTAYIAKLRINYACELLDKDESSVHEIAEKIGYHDYFYFTRLFKKITGKTPSQYRNDEH
ncbi:response regulator [Paenibacillus psychroresistens]|uniref:Response regulator n=1 Tax=Paenibacillus psychroresistens TaxID=1778678 RepID=A0A6B8RRN5_9BACL|nr:response regulator [Paenibacillus psychroresistens]QGQ98205.1 response regulator [Paenibacillus psychroresistens]